MTDRELLQQLFKFMSGRTYITMDDVSLSDMVKRYKHPPLTALNRVAMQMTARDYEALDKLMAQISVHLKESAHAADSEPA